MKTKIIDLILHPVRMRILMALAGKERTVGQINNALPDIPTATLYRHIKRLAQANIITVVRENRVRGTIENVYALDNEASQVPLDDINELNKDQHLRLFVSFITSLLGDFAAYLDAKERIDLLADGVGYRKVSLHLSDEELVEMSKALNQALLPYLANSPDSKRRERLFSTILIPAL